MIQNKHAEEDDDSNCMQWGVGPLIADRVELSRRGTFEPKTTTTAKGCRARDVRKARRNNKREIARNPRVIRKRMGNQMNEPSLELQLEGRRSGRTRSKGGPAF